MHALIEADGLSKKFGKVQALSELTLTLPAGQPVAILGPNGAGKTTFIRMVATLIAPDRGTLVVNGHDVVREPMAVRRMIGLAGQSAAVEEMMTGRENLVMVARLYGQGRAQAVASATRILEQMDLVEAADRQRQDLFRRHATAARPRGEPRRLAPVAAARRADDRPRPREPQRGVGRGARHERGRDRHRADDAVSRRGRPPRRLHRHHRRGPRHRPGHAERAQVPRRRRHGRAAHGRRPHHAAGGRGAGVARDGRAVHRPGDAPVLAGRAGRLEAPARRRARARRRRGAGGGHRAAPAHPRRGVPRPHRAHHDPPTTTPKEDAA